MTVLSLHRRLVAHLARGVEVVLLGLAAMAPVRASSQETLPQAMPAQVVSAQVRGHHHGGLLRPALILAAGGLASAWSHDEESPQAAQRLLDGSWLDTYADLGNVYGDGVVIGGTALGVLAVGRIGGYERTCAVGGDLCEAFLMSSSTVWGAKVVFNRRRPSGGPHSFPSGHTAVAFSVVPVLGHHFGWRGTVPAVLLATATGLGRMEAFRHFQSDVLAGAALGLACGDIVAGSGFLPGRAETVVLPGGVGLSIPF